MIPATRHILARHMEGSTARRLLLLLLAVHADGDDQVIRAPVQDLLFQSGLDQDTFTAALSGLVDAGIVSVARRTPLWLRLEPQGAPAPAHHTTPVTHALSAADVQRVVTAARIPTPDDAPLYWSRFGHVADLTDLLDHTGLTVDAICARLEALPPAGPVRRLRALKDSLGRAA